MRNVKLTKRFGLALLLFLSFYPVVSNIIWSLRIGSFPVQVDDAPRQISLKHPHIITASSSPRRRRLFECGWPLTKLSESLFPDLERAGEYTRRTNNNTDAYYSEDDILLFGMHGDCNGTGRRLRIKPDHVEQHFPGKALFVNGEPFGNVFNDYNSTRHLYQAGSVARDQHPHAIRLFYVAVILLERFEPQQWSWIFNPSKKRKVHHKYSRNAVVYMSRRCTTHREIAAKEISSILPIHTGARCGKDLVQTKRIPEEKIYNGNKAQERYWLNYKLYQNYKFCLCMENSNVTGYISEKILLAFLGGCVPIYWGTREVFEIFHPDAFIFYDITNPQKALDEIRHLRKNKQAFEEKLAQPILRNGSHTIEEFFSLSDEIGNGTLKRKIRTMLGLESS
jgi:hypothetical protein